MFFKSKKSYIIGAIVGVVLSIILIVYTTHSAKIERKAMIDSILSWNNQCEKSGGSFSSSDVQENNIVVICVSFKKNKSKFIEFCNGNSNLRVYDETKNLISCSSQFNKEKFK